jgi:hypothetical protein
VITARLCHLCRRPAVTGSCEGTERVIWCNFYARERLGIPTGLCHAARGRDYEQAATRFTALAADAEALAELIFSLPPKRFSPEYLAYMRSPQWGKVRSEALERAGHRCQNPSCEQPLVPELEAHHLTYRELGKERPEDVIVLCRLCHRLWGDRMKTRAWREISVNGSEAAA